MGLGSGRQIPIILVNAEGSKNNYPRPGGTGGSEKVKSNIDDDGAQGGEKRRPTTICCGNKRPFEIKFEIKFQPREMFGDLRNQVLRSFSRRSQIAYVFH